jgi:hypothetical protein
VRVTTQRVRQLSADFPNRAKIASSSAGATC